MPRCSRKVLSSLFAVAAAPGAFAANLVPNPDLHEGQAQLQNHYGNRNDLDEKSRTVASVLTAEQKAKMPVITHRVARPHPITGRKALYAVSGSSFGIVGMPDDEAHDAALRALQRHGRLFRR